MRRIHFLIPALLSSLLMGLLTLGTATQNTQAQADDWLTYQNADAAYSFAYPPNSLLQESADASQAYALVYVQFSVTRTTAYQGVQVMAYLNPSNQSPSAFVAAQYANAGAKMPEAVQRIPAKNINGRDAIQLSRDETAGSYAAQSVFVQGDGVMYRLNLFGGGVGGEVEPTPETLAMFDQLVQSFRVTGKPTPRATSLPAQNVETAAPSVATAFTYPLGAGVSLGYGVPTGIVVGGTRMEWLDYGIRNLDQWRTKCYGVDWSRMIHTGEDWYRDDYLTANTAGTPVYAVADGVVARHDAGISYPGNVVLIRHRLANGRDIYSMYGHVANVRVVQGQTVVRGQQIATVLSQGYTGRTPALHPTWDSHLHFEMRYMEDAGRIYTPATNAYGYNYPACTYAYPGRGYTYIVHPDEYPYPDAGYVDGSDFIAAHLAQTGGGCAPQELLQNGTFELGRTVWRTNNSSNANDPLIYTTRPRTGKWSGWLGNRLSYTDTLSQIVNVPSNSNLVSLTFWRYASSKEPAANGDDQMHITLRAADGRVLGTQGLVTSNTRRNIWLQEQLQFNLSGYAFPTATLSFVGVNDADLVSSFFVDDVRLQRECSALATANTTQTTQVRTEMSATFLPAVFADGVPDPDTTEPEKAVAASVCRNMLLNSDFENATTSALPWAGYANTPGAIYNVIPGGAATSLKDTLLDTSHSVSGFRSGRVGGQNGYWNELVQTAQLPVNTTRATLTFWRYLDTKEVASRPPLDFFEAGLETEKGIELANPIKLNNTNVQRGQWVQETLALPNAAALSGQKIWVTVKGDTDNTSISSLLVDDVELWVCSN